MKPYFTADEIIAGLLRPSGEVASMTPTTPASSGSGLGGNPVPDPMMAGGSPTNLPDVPPLMSRAKEVFGEVQEIRLDSGQSCGPLLDAIRQGLTEPYQAPVVVAECGSGNDGLCALVGDSRNPTQMRALITANPWMRQTVWSCWPPYVAVWLKVKGWRPFNRKFDGYFWIGAGPVPVGDVASDAMQFPLPDKGAKVLEIEFGKIVWPADWIDEFALEKIESVRGFLVLDHDKPNPKLNLITAAQYLITHEKVRYRPARNEYIVNYESSQARVMTAIEFREHVRSWLCSTIKIPSMGEPGTAVAQDVVVTINKLLAKSPQSGVAEFVNERLEYRRGSTITMMELRAAYLDYCEQVGATLMPERKFYIEVTGAIVQRFGVSKAHDISRPHVAGGMKARAGFRNVSLRFIPDPSEGSEGSDASPNLAR